MTRSEAVSMIKLQLGFKKTHDAEIVTALRLAQTTLEAGPTLPWFLISEDSFINLTSGEERIIVPANMLQEAENARLVYRPAGTTGEADVELDKEDYDHLKVVFAGADSGPPEAYALLGGYFRIFPKPNAVYTIRMIYFKQDGDLLADIENGWLKFIPMLLMGEAGKIVSGGPLRDKGAFEIFTDWASRGRAILHGKDIHRDMVNRKLQVGGPEA